MRRVGLHYALCGQNANQTNPHCAGKMRAGPKWADPTRIATYTYFTSCKDIKNGDLI